VFIVRKKEKDEHQSYLMVIDEEDNNIGQMRMKMKKVMG
jgi:predicted regulator of Ras-like GTPase activity (Roadblock/LC7/MglB family)